MGFRISMMSPIAFIHEKGIEIVFLLSTGFLSLTCSSVVALIKLSNSKSSTVPTNFPIVVYTCLPRISVALILILIPSIPWIVLCERRQFLRHQDM